MRKSSNKRRILTGLTSLLVGSSAGGAAALSVMLGATGASAGTLSYTCASNIDSAGPVTTCATLNTTIANLYGKAFNNVNASIYIQYGTTGLGESTSGFLNLFSYSAYRAALAATGSTDAIDIAALASLPATEPALYKSGKIEITSALGEALGLTGLVGTTSTGSACFNVGGAGCYNGIITISNPADLATFNQGLYYRSGSQASNAYDFYSVVEHETDEILGTESCVDTGGGSLSDGCGGSVAGAVDLFRYNAGARVFESATPGAYFSYDGGATNGAGGAVYNTSPNGSDFADFVSSCAHVQDAFGCLGKSLDITKDGNSEINILDAVGYNRAIATPEPGTWAMMLVGFGGLGAVLRLRRKQAAATA